MLGEALKIRFVRAGENADVADIDESVGHASAVLSAIAAASASDEVDVTALLKLIVSLVLRVVHARAYGSPDESDSPRRCSSRATGT